MLSFLAIYIVVGDLVFHYALTLPVLSFIK
ncbi:hypothetical protein VN97_g8943, partial [Penicillium thymicola]